MARTFAKIATPDGEYELSKRAFDELRMLVAKANTNGFYPNADPPVRESAYRDLEGFLDENTETELGDYETAEELVRAIAFALERRVKEIITEKGLIDTGALRASVVAVPADPSALPDADDLETDEEGNYIDARQTLEVTA